MSLQYVLCNPNATLNAPELAKLMGVKNYHGIAVLVRWGYLPPSDKHQGVGGGWSHSFWKVGAVSQRFLW